jgi:tetratricopeptide (TPR) repeat protein
MKRWLMVVVVGLACLGRFELALAGPALTSGALPPPSTKSKSPADRAYADGVSAMADGRLEVAKAAFERAQKLQAGHVDSLLGLAELAFLERQFELAAQHVQAALRVAPQHARALAAQGRLFLQAGKPAEAEAALRKSITAEPQAVRARIDLADLLAMRGALNDAEVLYREALSRDDRHPGAHYALGQVLMARGQLDAAVASFRSAAELAPSSILVPLALARLELGRGRPAPAMVEVEKVLKRDPRQLDALMLKSDVQELQGDAEGALRTLAQAAQSAPQSPFPWLRIGMVEHQRRRYEAAQAAYLKTLELDSRQSMALNNLAAMAVDRKADLKRAEDWARSALALSPKSAAYIDTLASVLRAQGRQAEAVQAWREALVLSPKSAEMKFHLGRALAEIGQSAEARKVLTELLTNRDGLNASDVDEAKRILNDLK